MYVRLGSGGSLDFAKIQSLAFLEKRLGGVGVGHSLMYLEFFPFRARVRETRRTWKEKEKKDTSRGVAEKACPKGRYAHGK